MFCLFQASLEQETYWYYKNWPQRLTSKRTFEGLIEMVTNIKNLKQVEMQIFIFGPKANSLKCFTLTT
jgi:hypothetical protein